MRSFFAAAFAFTVIATVHCGGRVEGNPDGGSCNAGDVCSTEGAQCTFETTYCNQPTSETCTCENGAWACPVMKGGNCPIEACPMDPYQGASCSTKGLECESMQMPPCTDIMPMCMCDGQQFQCPMVDCPVPMCPPPSEIQAGAPCNSMGSDMCPDTMGGDCKCMGTWQCADPVDAGTPD